MVEKQPITSAERGPGVLLKSLRLLEIAASSGGISLSDLARRADLPVSTTHRFIRALSDWGAMERDERGDYYIGLRLWEIASTAPRPRALRERVRPFLEDLHYATKQNVQLALLDDGEALVVEHLSRKGPTTAARVGGRLPLHASGVGQVLLAWGAYELRTRILDGNLEAFTPRTISNAKVLRSELNEVKRQGYALVDRTMPLPAVSIACPVFGRGNRCVAAIAVVLPVGADPSPYISAVMIAARSASRLLSDQGC